MHKYGEEISYKFDLLKGEDYDKLQLFTCGNDKLDSHIHNGVIKDGEIVDEDGLYFVFRDLSTEKIIEVVRHCRDISENMALADYILLYADEKAYRYYERNGFLGYSEFMIRENNQEINSNIPMYMQL